MAYSLQDASTPLVRAADRGGSVTRRCPACIVVGVATVAAVIVLLATTSGISRKSEVGEPTGVQLLVGTEIIDTACRVTLYPETCRHTLLSNRRAYNASPPAMTKMAISSARQGVKNTLAAVLINRGTNKIGFVGERVCHQTLASSIEQLDATLRALTSLQLHSHEIPVALDEIKVSLTAAMEFHTTCIDSLMETGALENHTLDAKGTTEQLLSNSLAFVNALSRFGSNLHSWTSDQVANNAPSTASEFLSRAGVSGFGRSGTPLSSSVSKTKAAEDKPFPIWMGSEQQESLVGAPASDVVVAKDGSGKYKSVQAAIDAAPKTGSATAKRYVIYIKTGVYNEQVTVPKKATNFMFIGDGAGMSIITGDKSVALTPGMTTFLSASLIVEGSGFIGQSFTARNTAGAAGHQAVAMRVSADKAAFYQCSFDSWQDTLYSHTFRQYYREVTILGTIDFIFGNSFAAFQSCTIIAKKSPLLGQQNTYTAQGKTDPGQATGLSFQSCTFDGTAELKSNTAQFKTYLGRPWKAYSTHVNLKCNLMGHIDPAGWLAWNTSDFGLKTSFFAEYQDFGSGANLAKRVSWSHQITDKNVAQKYQALPFIQANDWVPATKIPLTTTLP